MELLLKANDDASSCDGEVEKVVGAASELSEHDMQYLESFVNADDIPVVAT